MPEWLNGAVSKTVERVSVPRVRISLPPPFLVPTIEHLAPAHKAAHEPRCIRVGSVHQQHIGALTIILVIFAIVLLMDFITDLLRRKIS